MKMGSSSARLFILTALWGCLSFLQAATAQAQLIPLNGGKVMTCQFVNNTNVPNNQVYICVLANNAYLTPGGVMNAIVPGQNAGNYTMTLAQIDALSPAGLQFPVMGSGRMWFSFYSPLNMPIVAGPGIVQPNIGNPSDPNINIVFDWMEFDEGNDYIYCNTTQVNMFGIPYTMGLYNVGGGLNGASGIADCYSDIVSKYKAYMNSIPGASIFNSLVGSTRIVAPADGTFAGGGANGAYFDGYISQLWTEYQSKPLVISTGGNTYSGTTTGPGSQMTFTGPGGPYTVGYPTTQDALAASGVFASGNPTELALEVVMAAGINRHVLDNAANLNNPAAFYQTAPCNYYSAFFHTVNLNNLAYGFPYDDDDNQSDPLVSTNARALAITFSGCVPTPTSTSTATHTATSTSTASPTPTWTSSPTATPASTSTATYTATGTATVSPTPTWTSSPTATPTSTSTATHTATGTSTASPTPTWTSSPTAVPTSTNTAIPTALNTSTPTPTSTNTLSPTETSTPAGTPPVTSTIAPLRTPTPTLTPPPATATVTPVNTPINLWTPTPTVSADLFRISRNVFNETVDGTVEIEISSAQYAGPMSLRIYNSAGEHIRTLFDKTLTQPLPPTMLNWDGTNTYGQKVASGIYIIYLMKPLGVAVGRLVVLR
jgi:hypothetical protein